MGFIVPIVPSVVEHFRYIRRYLTYCGRHKKGTWKSSDTKIDNVLLRNYTVAKEKAMRRNT